LAVHYAPVTATMLCAAEDMRDLLATLLAEGKRLGVLAHSPQGLSLAGCGVEILAMPQSVEAYAQALYASLRQLDGLGLDLILVERPPQNSAWRAVNDRLAKAAGAAA